ncbi:MAG TPA: DUF2270 domain-containing protein [Mesorhizobium sp.]|nr:DUF2270 domain-containing protein [Mesorhizobium sp.]
MGDRDGSSASAASQEVPAPTPLLPLTRGEAVTVMSHFYRGEMARMAGWRDRIDRTSNWAITAVAAMLSLSLATPTAHHSVLVFAMLLVMLLLLIEGRRYRFYDVYRDRVRTLERCYVARTLEGHLAAEEDWAKLLADNLRAPRFNISLLGAMTRRLRRNYGWMYLILLLAWLLKITTRVLQPDEPLTGWRAPFDNLLASAEAGPLPGWFVLVFVLSFYAVIAWMLLQPDTGYDPEEGEVHV